MHESNEIGNAFAKALEKMLTDKPGFTVKAAAKELKISRQSFHSYLNGTLPRRNTLHKAVHIWDLKLDLGKYSFGRGAFGVDEKKAERFPVTPQQPTLWEALDAVKEKDLHVTMKRVGKVLRVDVRIEIPA
jgi:hypothetical protein